MVSWLVGWLVWGWVGCLPFLSATNLEFPKTQQHFFRGFSLTVKLLNSSVRDSNLPQKKRELEGINLELYQLSNEKSAPGCLGRGFVVDEILPEQCGDYSI